MRDRGRSVLDRAEALARRVLEKLGSTLDEKLTDPNMQPLSSRRVGELISELEEQVEADLKSDTGAAPLAPNRFTVLLTYEEFSRLSQAYIQSLREELRSLIHDYIANRRYDVLGPVTLEIDRDLFAASTTIKSAFFDLSPAESPTARADNVTILLRGQNGSTHALQLRLGAAPLLIGRAAGNAFRVDDPSLSRLHCSMGLRPSGEIVIADLGSANGTSVNGRLLGSTETALLKSGDRLGLGDVSFEIADII